MIQKPTKVLICLMILSLLLTGCIQSITQREDLETAVGELPAIPERLSAGVNGIPVLKVYNTAKQSVEKMDIESYIEGVVAGEMKNDWPMEALKAQAILARTFTLKFVSDKTSSYDGADISTDVKEAQAYNAEAINDRIRDAVKETQGIVMVSEGELPYAWFHAHAGGMTELPSKALEYRSDPAYLTPVKSPDSPNAPENVQNWTAEFTNEQVLQACRDAGLDVNSIDRFEIGEKGQSGRAVSFVVNGKTVSAPSFRIHIGASKLKSTLIDEIKIENDRIRFIGHGFGHGVGMSQWGAYGMAEDGKNAQEIIEHYFTGISLAQLW